MAVLPFPISGSAQPRGHVQVSRPGQNAPVSLQDTAELQSVSEHFDVALKMLFPSLCPPLFLSVPMLTPPLRSDPTVTKITRPPVRGCSKAENLPQPKPISVSNNLNLHLPSQDRKS